MQALKSSIRKRLPKSIIKIIRNLQWYKEKKNYKNKKAGDIFNDIYLKNKWGGEKGQIFSGNGTHDPDIQKKYILSIQEFFIKKKINTKELVVFDCGCGDFTIGKKIIGIFRSYIGGDISKVVIDEAKKTSTKESNFIIYDLSKDAIPLCDAVICRQVLQHLPNQMIIEFIRKLDSYNGYFIFTDHQPYDKFTPNIDSDSFTHIRLFAKNSGLMLDKDPFNLKYREKHLIDESLVEDGALRTWIYLI